MKDQNALAAKQTQILDTQVQQNAQDRTRMLELEQPLIDFTSKITSGDPSAQVKAAAPLIANITGQSSQAKERIYDTVGPGAGRDFALSQMEQQKSGAIAETMNRTYLGALDKQANLGAGFGAFSLQELGAGLRAGEGASNTTNSVMQAKEQGKASTMGFLGQLAGAAGTAAGGGAFGHL